jgi:diguanylate cyclase (GGDEF)-like protein/PAS domain S-box-containing protein
MIDLEQYKIIVESSPNMIWRSNITTECDYFNKTWLAFTGRTFEQEYGFGWAEGVHPEDYSRCVDIYLSCFKKRVKFEMDYRLKRYDGEYRWINDRGVPFNDKEGNFCGFIGSCMDITDKIEGQRLRYLAQNDVLCNTYNRQYSYQLLNDIFNQSQEQGLPFTILMIDIDQFKSFNDRYGHAAGDNVLTSAAGVLKKNIRESDILGRYGGDEFIIGLMQTGQDEALEVASRIRSDIAEAEIISSDGSKFRISVSIGVKNLTHEQTLDELVNNADKKLYEAKKEGKNQVKA